MWAPGPQAALSARINRTGTVVHVRPVRGLTGREVASPAGWSTGQTPFWGLGHVR
jgi:hypothetical protein